MPLKRRAAPRAEIMGWDGSAWQRLQVESSTYPNLKVTLFQEGRQPEVRASNIDGVGAGAYALNVRTFLHGFNGTNWDRWRNNTEVTVLPSATRTAGGVSPDQTNFNARGVVIYLNITAVSGTFAAGEGLNIHIDFKDPVSGEYPQVTPDIGPYTTTGLRCIVVYPGATDVRGYFPTENDVPLPRTWRVHYGITGTTPSFTFSVGASYVV